MKNKLHRYLPWKPTCWVGGILSASNNPDKFEWVGTSYVEISDLPDDGRYKYAAVKATSAILRAMRK